MNKKIKLLTTALVLCSSMLVIAPASAATKTDNNKETVVTENQNADNNGIDLKEDVPTEKPNTEVTSKSGEAIPIKGDDVCLRKKPGIHSTILTQLNESDGDVVAYYDYKKTYKDGYYWAHVTYFSPNGRIVGYIATDYLY